MTWLGGTTRCFAATVMTMALGAQAQVAIIGPEQRLGDPVTTYSAEGENLEPALATSGTEFTLVFAAQRAEEPWQIFVTRLSATGARLDGFSPPLSPSMQHQRAPAIAWGGGIYLVAWEEGPPGAQSVRATALRPDGTLMFSVPYLLSSTLGGAARDVSVSFDGTQFLVVWTEQAQAATADVVGALISPSTGILAPRFDIAVTAADERDPAVAWDGAAWRVAFRTASNGGDILGQRLAPNGSTLGASFGIDTSANPAQEPSIGCVPTRCAAAWLVPGASDAIAFARLDPTPQPTEVYAGNTQSSPHVLSRGTQLLVAFHQIYAGIELLSLPVSGAPTREQAYSMTNGTTSLAVAATAAGQTCLGEVVNANNATLRGSCYLNAPSAGLPNVWLAQSSGEVSGFALAGGPKEVLSVWRERNFIYNTWGGFRAQWLSDVGAPLADAGDLTAPVFRPSQPAAASSGGRTFVAWGAYQTVTVAELTSRLGEVSFDGGLSFVVPGTNLLETGTLALAAAPDGGFLLAWADDRRQFLDFDVAFTRLNADGLPLDAPGISIPGATSYPLELTIGFDGAQWVIVWGNTWAPEFGVARVSRAGTITDPGNRFGTGWSTSAASGEGEVLVLWASTVADAGADLFGARWLQDGGRPDGTGVRLLPLAGDQDRPRAVWVDGRYVLAFDSTHAGVRSAWVADLDFTRSPPVSSRSGVALPWPTGRALSVRALVSVGQGQAVVAGTRYVQEGTQTQSTRPFALPLGGLLGEGRACTADLQCGGLRCVASLCCASCLSDAGSSVDAGGPLPDAGSPLPDAGPGDAGGVAPVRFPPQVLPVARCGEAYEAQLVAEGTGPFDFALVAGAAGSLPPGLRLEADGRIVGRAEITRVERWSAQVRASAASGSAEGEVALEVSCTPRTLPVGCACGAGDTGSGLALLALALLVGSRAPSRSNRLRRAAPLSASRR